MAVRDLVDRGADAVVGDLADLEATRGVADQVNGLGRMDAAIHNAGVVRGPARVARERGRAATVRGLRAPSRALGGWRAAGRGLSSARRSFRPARLRL
jgi:NAD(P)-dependent dehydrogenase (short-subunit alcohol dehydrogenase family)